MDSGLGPSGRPGMTDTYNQIPSLRRPHLHQRGTAADRDLLAVLVEADMLEFDNPGIRTRPAAPQRHHRGTHPDRVAVEYRLRETHIGHAEIGDRGAQGRVADADPD